MTASRQPMSVWSRGALVSVDGCPACGCQAPPRATFSRQDDHRLLPDVWRMHACRRCRSLFLDPRPTAASLPQAYQDYYTHLAARGDPALDGRSFASRAVIGYLEWRFGFGLKGGSPLLGRVLRAVRPFRMKLDMFGRHIPRDMCRPTTRVLDVGCGNGAFLLRARSMGFQVQGTEPDPRAVRACRDAGLDVVEGDVFSCELDRDHYQWITLNHVLEHVDDPVVVLRRCAELLTPDGCLWLALPNPQSLGARFLGAGWSGLHPPYHLLIPSQGQLDAWLRSVGFDDIVFVRRGAQSAGSWRQSRELAEREGLTVRARLVPLLRLLGEACSTIGVGLAEETVVIARRRPK